MIATSDRNAIDRSDIQILKDEILKAFRDRQTAVVRAFHSFSVALSADVKLHDTELADFLLRQRLSTVELAHVMLRQRLSSVELRLTGVEKRLNLPPAA